MTKPRPDQPGRWRKGSPSIESDRERADRLQEDVEEYDAILRRQGDLLTRTVNALRGNPPPLTSWSHHDIPELAAEKVAEVARLTAERDALWTGTDPTPVEPGVVATDAQSLHHMLGQSPENRLNNFALMRHYALIGADCAARGDEWEIAKLRAERDALAGLLAEFVDNEPCSLDHHGYCQSHSHFEEGECHMARARAAIAGSEADTTDTQPTEQEDQS